MMVLVIDGDRESSELIRQYYLNEGSDVKVANNGNDGVSFFKTYRPDLVFLNIELPGKDGWQVCREIREISSKPIVFLSARGGVLDTVLGLELGADDFIVKPFDIREVAARSKAVIRRCEEIKRADDEVVRYESMEINRKSYDLKINGKSVPVPSKEFELLYFLALNAGKAFTRDQLLDRVWGFDYLGNSRTVDVHIKRLREKLKDASDKWCIKTVFGVGYKFELLS